MNEFDPTRCCGVCRHHRRDEDGRWYCVSEISDAYGIETGYEDLCEDFEER